jgi:hypothetical protein
MWKLNRLITTTLAIGLASVLVSFGCGGSGFFTEEPTEVTGENSYPVHITFGAEAESGMIATPGANKDVGGIGFIDMGPGDVQSPSGEWYQIIPVIADLANSGGYEVAVNADPANPSASIRCDYTYLSSSMYGLLVECSGILPEGAEGTQLTGTVRMNHYLRTLQADLSDAGIRINGINTDFQELEASVQDQITELTQWDVAEHYYDASSELDKYDRYGCDGALGADNHAPMVMDYTVAGDPFPGGIDSAPDGTAFTKGISLDANPGELYTDPFGFEAYRCNFVTIKPFAITIVFDADLDRDKYKECGLFVNDVNLPSENYCSDLAMNPDIITFMDADGVAVADSQSDVMIGPTMGISFGVAMDESTVTSDSILMTVTEDPLPAGLSDSRITIGTPDLDPLDLDDALAGDDFRWDVNDAYEYQLLPMELESYNSKALSGAVAFDTVAINITSGCAVPDTFNVNSATPVECWDPNVAYNNNYFPPTLTTWAQIDERGESALVYDLTNGMLLYRDSGKTDDTQQVVWINKPMNEPSGSWQLETAVSNVGGFRYLGVGTDVDAMGFNVADIDSTGYSIGLQTILIGGVGYTQTCYALYLFEGVPGGGSYLDDCDTETDIIFRLSYNMGAQDVVAEVSFDDGTSWHDIYAEGVQFPSAPHAEIDFVPMTGTQYGSIAVMSGNDGATKNNTADIEHYRFFGLDGLTGATPPQFSDSDYEEPGTFAMQLGGMLIAVTDAVNWNPIPSNDTDVRLDQDVAMIFDDDPSPIDWNQFFPTNMYVAPVQPLTGQAATIDGGVSGVVMGPGDYENKRAAWIEVTDAASFGQQIGDSGAYLYQKQDVELYIKNQELENGYVQRNIYKHPFSTACALSDHFFQDLRADCHYTVSNTDVSTAIAAGGSVLEITRSGAAGSYEISKPANLNMSNEWALSIRVNIDNMDRTWGSTDGIQLKLTDSNDEGYHIGVIAYDSLTGDGDFEMTCFAGRTNNLGQFIEANFYGPCDAYDGQDLIIQLQASFNPGTVTPTYSLDGGQTFNPFPAGDLGLLSYETWTNLYFNVETTFSPTSSMQVDLDRINALGPIGRSAAELDTSGYMVEPWGRPPKK